MILLPLALRSPAFLPNGVAAFLFENHFAWWLGAGVLGAVLIYLARARGKGNLMRAGQMLLGLTLLWILAAFAIDSPGERLYWAHTALATAVEKADIEQILSHFEPNFTAPNLHIDGDTLTAARNEIGARLKEYGIRESKITTFASTVYANHTADSRFTVLTVSEAGLIKSTWRLFWDDETGSDWKIDNAILEKLGDTNIPTGEVIH